MSVSRRSFLRSGALSALTAAVALNATGLALGQDRRSPAPSEDSQIPFQAQQSPLFYFKRETFEPYVGGVFVARAGAHSVEMTLTQVRDCTASAKSSAVTKKARATDCFALSFRSSGKLTDLTTIYDIEHAGLGNFPLFLTRRDGPRGTYFYEAVFNHVR
jgi:hypothetical protein